MKFVKFNVEIMSVRKNCDEERALRELLKKSGLHAGNSADMLFECPMGEE